MYVCVCKSVTDHQIRSLVSEGARSLRQVRDCLGVASQCGKCGKMANQIVKQTLESVSPAPHSGSVR